MTPACLRSGADYGPREAKRPKSPAAASEEPGAKAGRFFACPLHTAPPEGRASHLSHPSGPSPGHTTTLTPPKGAAQPLSTPGVRKQGHLSLVLVPHLAPSLCSSRGPKKSLAGTSYLATGRSLLVAEGQEHWCLTLWSLVRMLYKRPCHCWDTLDAEAHHRSLRFG